LSKTTWNWGLARPVVLLKTNGTEDACSVKNQDVCQCGARLVLRKDLKQRWDNRMVESLMVSIPVKKFFRCMARWPRSIIVEINGKT
jgi:hypothetical protein